MSGRQWWSRFLKTLFQGENSIPEIAENEYRDMCDGLPLDTKLPVLRWNGDLLTVSHDGRGVDIYKNSVRTDEGASEPYATITREGKPTLRISMKRMRDIVITLCVPKRFLSDEGRADKGYPFLIGSCPACSSGVNSYDNLRGCPSCGQPLGNYWRERSST